jgi:type IV pilus assembly protein PilA
MFYSFQAGGAAPGRRVPQGLAGFTLIELMIVVGIIGILVAIAAPNFNRYQAKARQSEAKIGLAAIYSAEKSFFTEYSVYDDACDAIGYTPEGQKRLYAIGWSVVGNSANAVAVGFAGGSNTAGYSTLNPPYTAIALSALTSAAIANLNFTAEAAGRISNGTGTNDEWTINDTKVIKNTVVGF